MNFYTPELGPLLSPPKNPPQELQDWIHRVTSFLNGLRQELDVKMLAFISSTAQVASAVAASLIEPSSLTTLEILNGTLLEEDLADSAVTSAKIQDSAVTSSELGVSAVTTTRIENSTISTGKYADSSVTTVKIQNLAVTTAKINDLAVTTAKIGASAVTATEIQNSAVALLEHSPLTELSRTVSLAIGGATTVTMTAFAGTTKNPLAVPQCTGSGWMLTMNNVSTAAALMSVNCVNHSTSTATITIRVRYRA